MVDTNRALVLSLLFATMLLLAGCASSGGGYSTTKANEIVGNQTLNKSSSAINSTETTVVQELTKIENKEIIQDNIKTTFKKFMITYEKDDEVNKAHVLMIIENTGKQEKTIACGDYLLIDQEKREYKLESAWQTYYNQNNAKSIATVQPGLSVIFECEQVFPTTSTLKILRYGTVFGGTLDVYLDEKINAEANNTSLTEPIQNNRVSYSAMIGKKYGEENQSIEIVGFDEEKTGTTKKITIGLKIYNNGKSAIHRGCSEVNMYGENESKYAFELSDERRFNDVQTYSAEIQPGLSSYFECTQTIPKDEYLREIEFFYSWFNTEKYPIYPTSWSEFEKIPYSFQSVGKTVSKKQNTYDTGQIEITLDKIGRKDINGTMYLRPYFTFKNNNPAKPYDFNGFLAFPYMDSNIIINGIEYQTEFLFEDGNFGNGTENDFRLYGTQEKSGGVTFTDIPSYTGRPISVKYHDGDTQYLYDIDLEPAR